MVKVRLLMRFSRFLLTWYLVVSKNRLEQEYVFSSTIATFLRALRAGVIHARHGTILLTHFGRLGPSFDSSAKLMIEVLREEGMYKDNGSLVSQVAVQAMKDVRIP